MMTIPEFQFHTNISMDWYTSKAEVTACLTRAGASAVGKSKMAFMEHSVTVTEFLAAATRGYSFCNLFQFDPTKKYRIEYEPGHWSKTTPVYTRGKNKGGMKLAFKSDKFFKGAQTVFVDVDKTRFVNVSDYLDCLTYKPTCVYMSFSDKKGKGGVVSRRFRLVYVFDRVLGWEEFKHVSVAITDSIVLDTQEPMDDDCGTRMSQYMNGVYGNPETYRTDVIYSVADFPIELTQLPVASGTGQPTITFSQKLVSDMEHIADYADFMHYYSWQFPYRYRIESDQWVNSTYQLTGEDYLQLMFYPVKLVDGQHRRRKLGQMACLRHLMFPDMTADTLLFNLYVDRHHFFDNSDGVITIDCLMRKVKFAFSKSPEELRDYCESAIEYWKQHRPKFILHPSAPHDIGTVNRVGKEIRQQEFLLHYDPSLSLSANLPMLGISMTTAYRYCQAYGIDPNPQRGMTKEEKRAEKRSARNEKIMLFVTIYDPDKTLMENQEILARQGIKLSKDTIARWSQKYWPTNMTVPPYFVDTNTTATPCPTSFTSPEFVPQSIIGSNGSEVKVEEVWNDFVRSNWYFAECLR